MRISDLANKLGMDRTTLTRNLSVLESMLKLQEFSLYDSIQKHWSLDQVQTHIKNNLDLIEKVLSAKEHLLIANKQDQLNKIAQIFTTVDIAGVIAAVLELHPLKELFDPEKHRSLPLSIAFLSTEVAIAFIATISFIMLIMFLVLRSHGFAKKIRDRFAPSYQE